MLAKGVNVNISTQDPDPPIHVAAKLGNENCVRLLLEKGADANHGNFPGSQLPFQYAALHGSEGTCRALLDKTSQVAIACRDTLVCAAAGGNMAVVNTVLAKGGIITPPDEYETSILSCAVICENEEFVRFFMSHVDATEASTALFYAARHRNDQAVEILLSSGALTAHLGPGNQSMFYRGGRTVLHVAAKALGVSTISSSSPMVLKSMLEMNGAGRRSTWQQKVYNTL